MRPRGACLGLRVVTSSNEQPHLFTPGLPTQCKVARKSGTTGAQRLVDKVLKDRLVPLSSVPRQISLIKTYSCKGPEKLISKTKHSINKPPSLVDPA